jgi:hypothetical protein
MCSDVPLDVIAKPDGETDTSAPWQLERSHETPASTSRRAAVIGVARRNFHHAFINGA